MINTVHLRTLSPISAVWIQVEKYMKPGIWSNDDIYDYL